MKYIKVIELTNAIDFEESCDVLLRDGYRVLSARCSYLVDPDDIGGPMYQAILQRPRQPETGPGPGFFGSLGPRLSTQADSSDGK